MINVINDAANVRKLASALHDDWRSHRLQADGSYESRIKTTNDTSWATAHGSNQVDIANTDFEGLPSDWQEENYEAAKVIVSILADLGGVPDLTDDATRTRLGDQVHIEWLKRNTWAANTELSVTFSELSFEEQEKDINQLRVALKTFA